MNGPRRTLGTEVYRQGDIHEDEAERTEPGYCEALETDPFRDPNLVPGERELEELALGSTTPSSK